MPGTVVLSIVYEDENEFNSDFTSKIWMTYRSGFPPPSTNSYTTDKGWGCMLRSGQMLLSNTLIIRNLGRDWRLQESKLYCEIMAMFLDSPTAPYSIQRIALAGVQFDKEVGQWFGPMTTSLVLKTLLQSDDNLFAYIPQDRIVFKDQIALEFSKEKGGRGMLLLLNLLLGIDKINPIYIDLLKYCFKLKYCMGIAGGRPISSLYFIGFQNDRLIYLDPHYERPSIPLKDVNSYRISDFQSCHCDVVRTLPFKEMDPSMVIGFYFNSYQEFEEFLNDAEQLWKGTLTLFSVEESEMQLCRIKAELSPGDDF